MLLREALVLSQTARILRAKKKRRMTDVQAARGDARNANEIRTAAAGGCRGGGNAAAERATTAKSAKERRKRSGRAGGGKCDKIGI